MEDFDHNQEDLYFDIRNPVYSLIIKGNLQSVLVKGKFKYDEDIIKVAEATDHNLRDYDSRGEPSYRKHTGRQLWRKIYSPLEHEVVAGWGSFEHPDFQNNNVIEIDLSIQALGISFLCGLPFGYGIGSIGPSSVTHNVLFVRKVEGQRFIRVGVGALFGKHIHKGWESSPFQEIELI